VKISPSNQTLILASERQVKGNKTSSGNLSRALDAVATGGTLQRLTIVAARPDDELVYVQADFASRSDRTDLVRTQPTTTTSLARFAAYSTDQGARDEYGNALSSTRSSGFASYLRPTEQYAGTQRNWSAAASVGLDVLA
jgi:hypothetical protein